MMIKKLPINNYSTPIEEKINEIIDIINAVTIDVDGTKCVDGSKKADIGELAYLQKENSDLKDEVELLQKKLEIANDTLRHTDMFFDGDYNIYPSDMHREIQFALKRTKGEDND